MTATAKRPEVWMRGPVEGIPPLLQPVAHSLLQSQEEVHELLATLPPGALWARPGGAASAGYHVQHAAGSLDRLFTYARGEGLSEDQRLALLAESKQDGSRDAAWLIALFDAAIERSMRQLRATPEAALRDARSVGRAKLPSTVLGLLFHAAEHTLRHVGQLATTVKVAEGGGG